MDEEPASSHDAPDRPTYNELLGFWESRPGHDGPGLLWDLSS
jgi:hypothetical protein